MKSVEMKKQGILISVDCVGNGVDVDCAIASDNVAGAEAASTVQKA